MKLNRIQRKTSDLTWKKSGLELSVFSEHRRVNLYLRVWLRWCARRTQEFILVRAERPYVQFAAARVTGTWFTVGVTNRREKESVAEPHNLMSPRSTCLSLDTKYSREDTKLRSSVEHTTRENLKIHIFLSGSQMKE